MKSVNEKGASRGATTVPAGCDMKQENKVDWVSWGQLFASILGAFALTGTALGGMILVLANNYYGGEVPLAPGQETAFILLLAGIGFAGILLLPSAVYAARALSGAGDIRLGPGRASRWSILLFPLFLAIGHLADTTGLGGRLLLVSAHLLANTVAVFWVLNLGRRGIEEESPQRFWGVFGSGLALSPALSLLLEFLALLVVGGLWYVYLLQHPALKDQVTNLVNRLPQTAVTPSIMERTVNKYLFTPGAIISIFSYVAVIIPLVEEFLKPIGLWIFVRRNLTPQEGFALGVLSGAGYALFENLTLSSNAEVWSLVMVSRFGTTAVHMLTSGFVGWGLAWAWSEGKYLRLAKAFITAVVYHGVWNALNVLSALSEFSAARDALGEGVYVLARFAPAGLVVLALGGLVGLARSNHLFRRDIMSRVEEP